MPWFKVSVPDSTLSGPAALRLRSPAWNWTVQTHQWAESFKGQWYDTFFFFVLKYFSSTLYRFMTMSRSINNLKYQVIWNYNDLKSMPYIILSNLMKLKYYNIKYINNCLSLEFELTLDVRFSGKLNSDSWNEKGFSENFTNQWFHLLTHHCAPIPLISVRNYSNDYVN